MESWKHKVIRESLELGWSYMKISKTYKLSIPAIMNEIDNDINLKIMTI